jgi:F420H(2)-dependent quinone reductase
VGRVPSNDPLAHRGPVERAMMWIARQRAGAWFAVNVANRIDPFLMKASGGRVRSSLSFPTVLLTQMGAKSGKKRTTPLTYFNDGDDVVVIASQGGAPRNPAWYHNVVANPEVELWTKGGGGRYRAKEAKGKARERLWELATRYYQGFAGYQERAGDRRIPVIVCSPQDE